MRRVAEDLRRLPFFVGLFLLVACVAAEVGAQVGLGAVAAGADELGALADDTLRGIEGAEDLDRDEIVAEMSELNADAEPPGLALGYLALLDGLLLFTVGLLALGLLAPASVHGRLQGVASLVVSLLIAIASFALALKALFLLLTMLALFLAVPFGTLVYLATWGFFDRGGATAVLSVATALELGFAVALLLAHQAFLRNKGLVLLVLTSLLAKVVVAFLHGLVPVVLVSITDAVAAIVAAVLALIWAIVMAVWSIPAVVRAVG